MPKQTKQALAVTAATTAADLMLQLSQLADRVNSFLTANTNNVYDTYWAAMPTGVWNADGTLGTADGSPVNTHPISVPAGAPLLVARNDLLTAVASLTNFQTYMAGGLVSATANAPRKYADLLNS